MVPLEANHSEPARRVQMPGPAREGTMGELTRFPGRCPERCGVAGLEQHRLLQCARRFENTEPEAATAFRLMAEGHWLRAAWAWRRVRRSGSSLRWVARDMVPFCCRHGRAGRVTRVLPFACPVRRPPTPP